MHYQDIVYDVQRANPTRSSVGIRRRLLKILEELGETSEAYLSRTAPGNYKNKSWEDYREESVDTLIVLLDVALTDLPNNSFPPPALLPNHLKLAASVKVNSYEELEDRKFLIAGAVAAANEHCTNGNLMGFYGSIARGVSAAAELVYAHIPGENMTALDERVYSVVTKKLDKWTRRMAVNNEDIVGILA